MSDKEAKRINTVIKEFYNVIKNSDKLGKGGSVSSIAWKGWDHTMRTSIEQVRSLFECDHESKGEIWLFDRGNYEDLEKTSKEMWKKQQALCHTCRSSGSNEENQGSNAFQHDHRDYADVRTERHANSICVLATCKGA
jgi:hypothetical protein